jgi:NAD(P)H-dependent FMN reductase
MKIAALGGSLRPHSFTYLALELALKKIEARAVHTELIDLRKLRLPFCSGEHDYPDYPDVDLLRQSLQSATGLLLATPEYHGNISGVLKNALDLLENEQMVGKVVGLIAVVGGVHSTNALNAMRLICRQLHCWVLPEQIVIPHAQASFNVNGTLKDKELEEKIDQLVGHLVGATRKLGQA